MQIGANVHTLIKNHLTIVKVVDGDGLIVVNMFNKNEEEVRLLGIDAPEVSRCSKLLKDEKETQLSGQLLMEMGMLSMKYLISLAPPSTNITLVVESKCQRDRFGRTLGYVILPDGSCLNERMVADGYAKPYNRFKCSRFEVYTELYKSAKIAKTGLFAGWEAF